MIDLALSRCQVEWADAAVDRSDSPDFTRVAPSDGIAAEVARPSGRTRASRLVDPGPPQPPSRDADDLESLLSLTISRERGTAAAFGEGERRRSSSAGDARQPGSAGGASPTLAADNRMIW
jgi:hypothetical protein